MPNPSVSAYPAPPKPRARWLLGSLLAAAVAVPISASLSGCESKSFFNPSELVDPDESNRLRRDGRARPRVQTILTSLDLGVEAIPISFTAARDVTAQDLQILAHDYRIGPGDLVQVYIGEMGPGGGQLVQPLRVSDTGMLNLPDLPLVNRQVRVVGLTELEAAQAIERAYFDAGILLEPQVSLIVIEPNSKLFNILGSVSAPGSFVLPHSNFRLLDALTRARGAADPDVQSEYIYIIRTLETPGARHVPPVRQPGSPGDPLRGGRSSAQPQDLPQADPEEWPFEQPTFASAQGQPAQRPTGFQGFQPPQEPIDSEIIRVPLRDLLNGNLRYNVVIRAEDTIIIPPPITGEYYVGGHVVAPGVFAILPGRRITMKQAIISARMLDEVAIPRRTQLIRRINDQDVFVRVDLSKVFVGEEPDIYLEPNDMILVGTTAYAPFLAAFRNGFRVTYGFGFLYDRNFAYDRDTRFRF